MSFTIVKFFYILFTTVKAFYQRQIPSVTTANDGFTENEPINFSGEYFDNKYIKRKNQTKYQPPVTP